MMIILSVHAMSKHIGIGIGIGNSHFVDLVEQQMWLRKHKYAFCAQDFATSWALADIRCELSVVHVLPCALSTVLYLTVINIHYSAVEQF